ncbi:DinB family protein [Pseudomonas sp. LS44]|uniref:DinB family protein n=1 Tax=Pseudomonas sp. LS44 TaxID=1357074 RepID=UPI00215B5E77|nr:DinB family protein [Pseudomonas sp. LS44]UVE18410.1 DinB family protein [Pseudomonas sp. LS44]
MARRLACHLERLLAYNGWANRRLLASLRVLDEASYRAPCGLFFGSLHGTLNHLAVADRLWLARVRGEPQPFTRLDAEAAGDLESLAEFLAAGLRAWQQWLSTQDDDSLAASLHYRSVSNGEQQRGLADIVSHLVNHGSHHRGQATAALTAMGQPAPELDYIYFTADPACL